MNKFVQFCSALYKMYMETDASLVEINPLVILKDGDVVALDAKMNFDDNALYRHKELLEYRDLAEEEPRETQAKEYDLAYIALDGNIGCMVNGAGLAMATMDIIKLVGGEPANFLDVGGGASKEKVTAAFKLILADPNVKAMLVNIFGGIMKCDVIAEGIIAAAKEVQLKVPLVVRLEGTNVEKGKEMLRNSGLAITPADNLRQAAEKAVAAAQVGLRTLLYERNLMSILVNENTKVLCQGITGSAGSFHAKQMLEYGTKMVGGVTPGKGGTDFEGKVPIFNTVSRGGEADRRQRLGHLRPAAVRRRRHHGGRRRGHRPHHHHHRGHPGPRHGPRQALPAGQAGRAAHRPQLPRRHHPGRSARSASCRATSTSRAASAWSPAPARSPTRPSTSSPSWAWARPPRWASAAIRSTARTSSTCSSCSTRTRRPTRSS